MNFACEFWLLPLDNLSQVAFWAIVKLLLINSSGQWLSTKTTKQI